MQFSINFSVLFIFLGGEQYSIGQAVLGDGLGVLWRDLLVYS